MKKLILIIILALFITSHAHSENVVYETEWMASSELEVVLKEMNGKRLFPCYVEGRLNGIIIQYKSSFCPFPQKLNYFQSRWGLSDDWYIETKKQFESSGMVEYFHSTYLDLSNSVIHQATWVLLSNKE